jgi:MFS family permease
VQFVFGRVEFPGARRWGIALPIDATGSGLLRPITILYFTVYRHLSIAGVGLALGVGGTIALWAAPLAGGAVDRFGPKPALLMFWAIEATSFASYALVRNWPRAGRMFLHWPRSGSTRGRPGAGGASAGPARARG